MPAPQQNKDFPYWLLIVLAVGGYFFWRVLTDDLYTQVLQTLSKGIWITVFVTLIGFGILLGIRG